jgi:16S rRNA processing protein RimM
VKLKENEYYKSDLMEMNVISEDGSFLGKLTDILETGANDVYVVRTEQGKELLFPAIRECIKNVDMEKNEMTVHIMDGLLD